MKKEYVKPFIRKHSGGYVNKFGMAYKKGFRDEIEGQSVTDLVNRFGSPLFVFSERIIRQRYRELVSFFSNRYPKVQFAWSYKTNYLDAICALLHQEGEIAEVVSEFEYQKARRLGVPGNKIIYNGPYKPLNSIQTAFKEHAYVNIDNFDEIFVAEQAAKQLGCVAPVGIRINLDTGIYPQWSRFGFNLEDGSALHAAKRITRNGQLSLRGLHTHIGTFILEPRAYATAAKKIVDFMCICEKELSCIIEYIDLGGGFPSRNRLKGTYLPPEVSIPPLNEYALAITDTLLNELSPKEIPMLFMETGRAIIDEAGFLITTVEAVKRLPDGTKSYIIDAGVNILYTSAWYNFKVELDRDVQGAYENSVVYGPLCMNIDVILESIPLPPLTVGTRLILSPVGAYNITQWMQFIRYRPAVVMIMEDNSTELIRRAETLDDIVGPERLPEKFKKLGL